ncbi:MAG: MopE-related protein [Myxococcota bacterium]
MWSGCLFVTEEDVRNATDADRDGRIAAERGGDDCDDTDPDVHPGAPDAWYDGIDANCDGRSDFDQDGDGLDAYRFGGVDCDDTTPVVGAGSQEWVPDCDGDGAPVDTPVTSCGPPETPVCTSPTLVWIRVRDDLLWDCDDTNPAVNPGVTDTPYNGVDDDCDGANDYDADGDGWVDAAFDASVTDALAPFTGDCDDRSAGVHPDAPDFPYDGVDANCDGSDDYDADGDGFRRADFALDPALGDCNDLDPLIGPGADDAWYDGVDANCDGADDFDADADGWDVAQDCDDLDPTVNPGAVEQYYDGVDANCDGRSDHDLDGDGFDADVDCDDTQISVYPGAPDVPYDGVDADCDGANDFDADGDGYVPAVWASQAGTLGSGDCDDDDASVHPGLEELWYDGIDTDCDGRNDFDRDGDGAVRRGYGTEAGGSAPRTDDCDDDDPSRSPGLPEIWYDGIDQDCDGRNDFDRDRDAFVDQAYDDQAGGTAPFTGDCDDDAPFVFPGAVDLYYDGVDADCAGNNDYDFDRDGFVASQWAGEEGGTAPAGGDCDDIAPFVNPAATTDVWYDGEDTDCDGRNDYDQDGDGYVAIFGFPGGSSLGVGDCDDTNGAANPGVLEIWYDGYDQDCDGRDDFDRDGDGVVLGPDCDDGDPAVSPNGTDVPYDGIDSDCDGHDDFDADRDGYRWDGAGGPDCNDLDPAIRPGAGEIWYDGIDQDCDGRNDHDRDGDGHVREVDAAYAGGTAPFVGDCDDDPSDDSAIALRIASDQWWGREIPVGTDLQEAIDHNCGTVLHLAPGTHVVSAPLVITGRRINASNSRDVARIFEGPARIEAAGAHPVFRLPDYSFANGGEGMLGLRNLVVAGGSTSGDGGCIATGSRNSRLGTSLIVDGVTFEGCSAAGRGGAISLISGHGAHVLRSVFVGNQANEGGAIASEQNRMCVDDSTFDDNHADADGGAIWMHNTPTYYNLRTSIDVRRSAFTGGSAVRGGGIYFYEDPSYPSGETLQLRDLDFVSTAATEGAAFKLVRPDSVAQVFGEQQLVSITGIRIDGAIATGPNASVLELDQARGSDLLLREIRIRGGTAERALVIQGSTVADLDVEDVVVEGVAAQESVRIASSTVATLRGVRITGQAPPSFASSAGLRMISTPYTLTNASIVQNAVEAQLRTGCTSCTPTLAAVLLGSPVDVFGAELGSAVSVTRSALVEGAIAWSIPANAQDTTSFATATSPFLQPWPAVDAHLDPADPTVQALSQPDASCAGDPECGHPGYWGIARPATSMCPGGSCFCDQSLPSWWTANP